MTRIWPTLLILVYIVPTVWGVYHALLYKRDPRAAMGWIMACVFIPYAGPIAYFLFGVNRVRSRARGLQRRFLYIGHEYAPGRSGKYAGQQCGPSPLYDAGGRLTGRPLIAGNSVQPMHNGEAAYPAMLGSIAEARERVYLSTYILKADTIGKRFADALEAACLRGVDVRVLVDGFGEWYGLRRGTHMLKARGIPTVRFLPPRLIPPSIYVNLRNHRKLLIADTDVAYAGGMNISDYHTSVGDRPREVSDIHFALRGPVVAELAELFAYDWHFAGGDKLPAAARLPAGAGSAQCRVIPDGPDESLDALAMTIETVISAARRNVDIVTPYFLPRRELIAALQSAVLRGVRVRLVLPGKNNLFYMHWANRNILAELLRWDIEAWYQPAPFCHAKLLCVDDDYTLIGSANLDPRSLRLNFEVGIEVMSRALNRELTAHIDGLTKASRRIGYRHFEDRSIGIRLRDSAAALFTPYL